MSLTESKRKCPICSFNKSKLLQEVNFSTEMNTSNSAEYKIIACAKCKLIYVDSTLNQNNFDIYYTDNSQYEGEYLTSGNTDYYTYLAEQISNIITDKTQSIIDIGCGNGELLIELQKKGFSNLTALDPSKCCIEKVKGHGITGIQSSIFSFNTTKKYEHVILSGVLEHIFDISGVMSILKELLVTNGLLFVIVPDSARYKDYNVAPYYYFSKEHINHFDELSLINLGIYYGWSSMLMSKGIVTVHDVQLPVIFHVFVNTKDKPKSSESYSTDNIKQYIEMQDVTERINKSVASVIKNMDKIVIWGGGNLTSHLLACSDLSNCNISYIVDNDSNKHGKRIHGHKIVSPSFLVEDQSEYKIVVIASLAYNEIKNQISKLGLNKEILIFK